MTEEYVDPRHPEDLHIRLTSEEVDALSKLTCSKRAQISLEDMDLNDRADDIHVWMTQDKQWHSANYAPNDALAVLFCKKRILARKVRKKEMTEEEAIKEIRAFLQVNLYTPRLAFLTKKEKDELVGHRIFGETYEGGEDDNILPFAYMCYVKKNKLPKEEEISMGIPLAVQLSAQPPVMKKMRSKRVVKVKEKVDAPLALTEEQILELVKTADQQSAQM